MGRLGGCAVLCLRCLRGAARVPAPSATTPRTRPRPSAPAPRGSHTPSGSRTPGARRAARSWAPRPAWERESDQAKRGVVAAGSAGCEWRVRARVYSCMRVGTCGACMGKACVCVVHVRLQDQRLATLGDEHQCDVHAGVHRCRCRHPGCCCCRHAGCDCCAAPPAAAAAAEFTAGRSSPRVLARRAARSKLFAAYTAGCAAQLPASRARDAPLDAGLTVVLTALELPPAAVSSPKRHARGETCSVSRRRQQCVSLSRVRACGGIESRTARVRANHRVVVWFVLRKPRWSAWASEGAGSTPMPACTDGGGGGALNYLDEAAG